MSAATRGPAVPVIALTGYLGAGKTSLLNHVLRAPGARIGVVVNDFGDVNIDAALVTGQVDEPAAITGGCICCLPDDSGLDDALEKLTDPKLALDAVIVEASGIADPLAVARLIRYSGVERVRPGGVVDVIDISTHFDKVDTGGLPLARYGAASLVVVNKMDRLPEAEREQALARVEARVRERNSHAHIVGTVGARVDPALLYDVSEAGEETGQLSFRELLVGAAPDPGPATGPAEHVHADAVTVRGDGCVDPGAVLDLLEQPPAGVYRMKGTVAVRYRDRIRRYLVNVVGPSVHVGPAPANTASNSLVAIGTHLDAADVRSRLEAAVQPVDGAAGAVDVRRLQRYRRISI